MARTDCYLGKSHVDERTLKRLDGNLSADQKKQLFRDIAYAPVWIGKIIRRMAEKK
jgi:hypothetical protein